MVPALAAAVLLSAPAPLPQTHRSAWFGEQVREEWLAGGVRTVLNAPADFDLSPYFKIVKPTIEEGFNYKGLTWAEDEGPATPATRQAQ